MKYASDFRAIARDALRGKWVIAVIVGLVAALLGAGSDGPRVKLNISDHGANLNVGVAGQTIYSTGGSPHSGIGAFLIGSAIYIVLLALVFAAVYFVLGSIIQVAMPDSIWSWWIAANPLSTRCLRIFPAGKRWQPPDFCRVSTSCSGRCCSSSRAS